MFCSLIRSSLIFGEDVRAVACSKSQKVVDFIADWLIEIFR